MKIKPQFQQFLYRCMSRKMQRLLSDKTYLECEWRERTGRAINWQNPQGFNEKITWLKLHDRNPLLTQCSDKFAVRKYIKAKGLGRILNELHGVYDRADQIDFANLPKSCVLKATHGSGWNVIIKHGDVLIEKQKRNIRKAKSRLRIWLGKSQHIRYREWCYKNIKPRIICEKFLQNVYGSLHDYKIHCFHGKPLIIQNIVDRASKPSETFYDTDWNQLDLLSLTYPPCQRSLAKPACLPEMLQICKTLSADFDYVRVDLYDYNGVVIFGEMTFNPGSGGLIFNPPEWDIKLGKMLNLPTFIPKHSHHG